MSQKITVELNVTPYAPDEQERPEYANRFLMDEMDDQQREATLNIMRGTLIDLTDTLDQWVPDSFIGESGHRLDVVIVFDMQDVNNEVLQRYNHAGKRFVSLKDDLLQLKEELQQ